MKGQKLTCGRIVKYCLGAVDGREQWRPAIVVETFDQLDPPHANLVVFLDGANDRWLSGNAALTVWRTSVRHGTGENHWLWPDELDEHIAASTAAQ